MMVRWIHFAGRSSAPVASSLTDSKISASTLTTYTFSTCAFGAAAADRIIVVGVCGQDGASAGVSSMTIGGVAATEIVESVASVGGNAVNTALYYAAVPTGTTGDVVVTFGGNQSAAAVGVWAVLNSSGTPSASASNARNDGNPNATTINCPANGAILGYAGLTQSGSDPTSATWTNLTESLDQTVGAGERLLQTGADDEFATAQTALSITTTPSGAGASVLLLVSFGPVA